jgi:hypothetical protein
VVEEVVVASLGGVVVEEEEEEEVAEADVEEEDDEEEVLLDFASAPGLAMVKTSVVDSAYCVLSCHTPMTNLSETARFAVVPTNQV